MFLFLLGTNPGNSSKGMRNVGFGAYHWPEDTRAHALCTLWLSHSRSRNRSAQVWPLC
jgi:hypothetical protein